MIDEYDDQTELIPSFVVPTIELSPSINNSQLENTSTDNDQLQNTAKKNDHHFYIQRRYGLSTLLTQSYWSNHPLSLKKSYLPVDDREL
ncbi:unnamed protein product [Rotaria sp. Silwood1]|nr:unnamed protein product [Rotaria sp. Silwood1]